MKFAARPPRAAWAQQERSGNGQGYNHKDQTAFNSRYRLLLYGQEEFTDADRKTVLPQIRSRCQEARGIQRSQNQVRHKDSLAVWAACDVLQSAAPQGRRFLHGWISWEEMGDRPGDEFEEASQTRPDRPNPVVLGDAADLKILGANCSTKGGSGHE